MSNFTDPLTQGLNLKLNPNLDANILKATYSTNKNIVIENFLDDNSANSLYEFYTQHMPNDWWSMSYSGVLPEMKMDRLNDNYIKDTDSIKAIYDTHYQALAETKFCYIFNRTTKHFPACTCGHCQYIQFMKSPKVLELLSYITEQSYTELGEFFASEFTPGQFLSKHHDREKGKLSMVYGLSKDWDPSFGGNLYILHDDWKTIETVVQSGFNRLSLMGIPDDNGKPHFVSQVANGVTKRRLSITGWLS